MPRADPNLQSSWALTTRKISPTSAHGAFLFGGFLEKQPNLVLPVGTRGKHGFFVPLGVAMDRFFWLLTMATRQRLVPAGFNGTPLLPKIDATLSIGPSLDGQKFGTYRVRLRYPKTATVKPVQSPKKDTKAPPVFCFLPSGCFFCLSHWRFQATMFVGLPFVFGFFIL